MILRRTGDQPGFGSLCRGPTITVGSSTHRARTVIHWTSSSVERARTTTRSSTSVDPQHPQRVWDSRDRRWQARIGAFMRGEPLVIASTPGHPPGRDLKHPLLQSDPQFRDPAPAGEGSPRQPLLDHSLGLKVDPDEAHDRASWRLDLPAVSSDRPSDPGWAHPRSREAPPPVGGTLRDWWPSPSKELRTSISAAEGSRLTPRL